MRKSTLMILLIFDKEDIKSALRKLLGDLLRYLFLLYMFSAGLISATTASATTAKELQEAK